MPETILSVSEFIDLVNQTLEFAYQNVVVEGEVAEFEIKQAKWVHFKLKDAAGSVECFMTVWGMRLPIEDGIKLKVVGVPKLTKWGRFSLTVQAYELSGEGALAKAYELLKQKLITEGLFDDARKRSLPVYPKSIGLITSIESEAYKDFIKILNERWGGVKVIVAPVQVQGLSAPDQIVAAINFFNQLADPVEALVLTRGGGSAEDLQAFSSEIVVRAIAASRTPTIVGVGHEGDVSLADLAADIRASTPTDAARKVVPSQTEIRGKIDSLARQLSTQLADDIDSQNQRLMQQVNALDLFMRLPQDKLASLSNHLRHLLFETEHQIESTSQLINQSQMGLVSSAERLAKDSVTKLVSLSRTLSSFDPIKVLDRGYAIVRKGSRVLRSAKNIKTGDELMLQLAKDKLTTEVKHVQTSH